MKNLYAFVIPKNEESHNLSNALRFTNSSQWQVSTKKNLVNVHSEIYKNNNPEEINDFLEKNSFGILVNLTDGKLLGDTYSVRIRH